MTDLDSRKHKLLASRVLSRHEALISPLGSVGVSIGIVRHGDTFFLASGSLYRNGGSAINQDSVFEIGSITKSFTALLASLAICSNSIALSEPIDNLLPTAFQLRSSLRNRIKVTDLASHQSGLPTLTNDHYFESLLRRDAKQPFKLVDTRYIQQVLSETTSLADYGLYSYSNFAYALLGLIVEQCTGMSYEQALVIQLTDPLLMHRTQLNNRIVNNQVGRYNQQGEAVEPLDAQKITPAGGVCSTAADLVKYIKAQLNPDDTLLGKAIALSHQKFCMSDEFAVGLGWNILNDGNLNYFEKTGDSFGNSSLLRFDKENKIGVVVLVNHQNSSLAMHLADELYSGLL